MFKKVIYFICFFLLSVPLTAIDKQLVDTSKKTPMTKFEGSSKELSSPQVMTMILFGLLVLSAEEPEKEKAKEEQW